MPRKLPPVQHLLKENPSTTAEYRAWVMKVIEGWHEYMRRGTGSFPPRWCLKLCDCVERAGLHADRVGLHSLLGRRPSLIAHQPEQILRYLRLCQQTADAALSRTRAEGVTPVPHRSPAAGQAPPAPSAQRPATPNAPDRDPLPPLPVLDGRLYAIHYSQELQANSAAQTPPTSAIVVQQVLTGQQLTFAAFQIAEQRGIPPADFLAHLPALEKQLLANFFDFVARTPAAVWLHWAMRQPRFGFEVLAQRARIHGLTPAEIPVAQRFDLSSYLKRRFGDDYAPHPRFWSVLARNDLLGPDLLNEEAAAASWAQGEYARLIVSLSSKVDAVADLFDHVRRGTFKVAPSAPEKTTAPNAPPSDPKEESTTGDLPRWVFEHFRQKQYRLLCLLWGKQEVPIRDIHKTLYQSATGQEEALDKVKDRANRKLAEINKSYEIVTRRAEVYVLKTVT